MYRMSKKTRLLFRKIALITVFLFSGCAGFSFNAQMCDPNGPNAHNMPQECYNYTEEDAQKASELPEETPCNDCSKPKQLELEK